MTLKKYTQFVSWTKETPDMGSKQFDYHSHYCISNDVKANCHHLPESYMERRSFIFVR